MKLALLLENQPTTQGNKVMVSNMQILLQNEIMITNSAQGDLCFSRKLPSPFNSSSCELALLAKEVTNKA